MSEKEKMLAGEFYLASDPELVNARLTAKGLYNQFNLTKASELEERKAIIKSLFGRVGKDFHVEPTFKCDYGFNIFVGENFYANFDCIFLDVCKITIGNNCLIAPGVHIYTATHPLDRVQRVAMLESGKPVTIGDDCWIGGGAIINPGVTLGNNVVVASGSVVTKSFGNNVLIGGNPARVIRVLGKD